MCFIPAMSETIQAERTTKAGYLALSEMVSTATRLGAMIILARIFTQVEFGNYRQVLLPYAFIMPILALGLPDGLLYFLSIHRDRARNVLANNLVVLIVMSIGFGIFLLVGGNHLLAWGFKNPELVKPYLLFAPFALLSLPTASLRGCLVVMGRLKTLAAYTISNQLIVFAAVMFAAWYTREFEWAILARVIAVALFFIPAMWLMTRACETGAWEVSREQVKTQVGYSLPLGLSSIINQASRNLDKLVVAVMCPTEIFAIYVIGAMELPIINIVANSAASVITPDFTEYYRDGRKAELLGLWRRATVKCATIILPVMVFLMLAAQPAVVGVFSERYAPSVRVFQIYLLLLPMRMFVFGPVFLATKQTRKIVNRSVVALCLNAVLTVGLTWKFGYIGAAVATVLTFVIWIFPYNLVFSCRYLESSLSELFDLKKMGLIMICSLIGCIAFLVPSQFRPSLPLLEVIMMAIIYFLIVGLLMQGLKLIDLEKIVRGGFRSLGLKR